MIQHKQLMRRASLSSQQELGLPSYMGGSGDETGKSPMITSSAMPRRFSWSRTRSIDIDDCKSPLRNRQFPLQQRRREPSIDMEQPSSPPPPPPPVVALSSTPTVATSLFKNYPVETRRIVKNQCFIGSNNNNK